MSSADTEISSSPAPEWPLNLIDKKEDRDTPPEIVKKTNPPVKIWMAAELGQGSTGLVVAGMVGEEKLAAKVLAMMSKQGQKEELGIQVERWKGLQHPHVLRFRGSYDLGFGQVALLSPYMENGNLTSFIANCPFAERLQLLRQAAEGVNYLHTEAKMVHGDLKCANILVSAERTALLCDFGLTTIIMKMEAADPTRIEIRMRHTAQFAAPELFNDKAKQASSDTGKLLTRSKTTYTDVFAFGRLIYEAITGAAPWTGLTLEDIRAKVMADEHPARTSQFSNDLWELCESCWAQEPADRPNIAKVLATMNRLAAA